jgi:hypothetical protein
MHLKLDLSNGHAIGKGIKTQNANSVSAGNNFITSDPELISADTLLRSLAKVTFFSNFASVLDMATVEGADCESDIAVLNVVSVSSPSAPPSFALSTSFIFRSLKWISSPKLTLRGFC